MNVLLNFNTIIDFCFLIVDASSLYFLNIPHLKINDDACQNVRYWLLWKTAFLDIYQISAPYDSELICACVRSLRLPQLASTSQTEAQSLQLFSDALPESVFPVVAAYCRLFPDTSLFTLQPPDVY